MIENIISSSLSKQTKKLILPYNTSSSDNPDLSYDEYTSLQIDLLQKDLHTYLLSKLNNLNTLYSIFKNNTTNFILRKMSLLHNNLNINDNNIFIQKFAISNIYNSIQKIFDIHAKIILNLKENFKILNEFLQSEEYFQKNKPAEEYLIKNISNIYSNWLFTKIDFSKYKLNTFFNDALLDKNVMNYINDHPENKFSCYQLMKENISNKNIENDMKINTENKDYNVIIKNKSMLKYINFINFKEIPLDLVESSPMEKIEKIEFNYCSLKIISNIQKVFPSLIMLYFQNSAPDFYEIDIMNSLKLKLQKISFSKTELITQSFNKIISILINIDEIRKNLTHLSFSDNFISIVDFTQFLFQSKKLHKLQEMNFENNRINKFLHNPDLTPNLRVLNMTVNSFSKSYFTQINKEKTIILLGNNNFLTNPTNNKQYCDILKHQLETFDYNLEYLTFNGLFYKETCKRLPEIHIHKSIQISVRKLDLSNCSLDDNTLIQFFKTNPGFLELRFLRLSENYLTDSIFQLFNENNLHLHFPKLKIVIFTSNNISGDKISEIHNFIVNNKSLTRLVLLKNPLSRKYIIQNRKESSNDNLNMLHGEEEKLNEFARMLKMVEEINRGDKGADRNYLNRVKNEKGFVVRFDVGDKIGISNYNVKYSDVKAIRCKGRLTTYN